MASKYHAGELCKHCFLCGKKYNNYNHYKVFHNEEKQFIVKHLDGKNPPDSSCICMPKPQNTAVMIVTFLSVAPHINVTILIVRLQAD